MHPVPPPLAARRRLLAAMSAMPLALAAAALSGCAAVPEPPQGVTTYDFGAGVVMGSKPGQREAKPPLALAIVAGSAALDHSTAVWYRLGYDDENVLRPYRQARWSMPPTQLVRQRLADYLGRQRTLAMMGDTVFMTAGDNSRLPPIVRVELEEFSQLFSSPERSVGLVRMRVTLVDLTYSGEKVLAQRALVVQRPAPTNDAPGAVRALAEAVSAAAQDLLAWLDELKLQGLPHKSQTLSPP